MKRITIIASLCLGVASFSASAAEPDEARAAGLDHQTLERPQKQGDRVADELTWHDYQASDRGTTFREFWTIRKKVQNRNHLPRQAAPNIARASKPGAEE